MGLRERETEGNEEREGEEGERERDAFSRIFFRSLIESSWTDKQMDVVPQHLL